MWVSFRNSIIEFAPPALLMTSILLVIAAALASFVPWVEQQIGKLFETVVNGVYDAVKRKPRSSGAGSGSFAQSSLAALGVRSAMVTGAAVVTVGALALAVPGNTLPMKLGTPPDASASLSVGTFALKIPGKPIDLPLEVVPPAPAKLNVPRVELRLPELVPANGGALDRFTQELAAYRRFLERERSRQKENESLLAENRLMAWRTNALYEALLDRPTRDDFEALRTDVRRQRAASERLSESIDHAAEAQKFQSRLQVAELARHINGQNDHLYTALFRRSMAHQNCEIFSFLAQVDGGGFLNRSGCIERGRTDAIRQIWQQSAPALLANTQTQTVAERRKP